MADLLMGNLESDTSDDEIREFLAKYGFPPFDGIEHIPGDGSRPAVLLTFKDADPEALRGFQSRIQGVFWHNRKITVQVMTERFR
jgi:hypothetical protein